MNSSTKLALAAAALAVAGVSASAGGAMIPGIAPAPGTAAPMPAAVVWLCLPGLAAASTRRPLGLRLFRAAGDARNPGAERAGHRPMQLRDFRRAG